jgi:hypothetical protein
MIICYTVASVLRVKWFKIPLLFHSFHRNLTVNIMLKVVFTTALKQIRKQIILTFFKGYHYYAQ